MADWERLDSAFTLPEDTPQELAFLYEELCARIRRETDHLPLNALVQLQIERNLYRYIKIKHRERFAIGHPQGFASLSEARDEEVLWLNSTKILNDQVFRIRASDRKAVEDQVKGEVKTVLAAFIEKLPGEHRDRLKTELVQMLEAANL
jgi:hypothetical protein